METFAAILTAFLFWAFISHVAIGNRLAVRKVAGKLLVKQEISLLELLGYFALSLLAVAMFFFFGFVYSSSARSGYPPPSWMIFIWSFVTFEFGWIMIMRAVILQPEFRRHGIVTHHRGGPFSFVPWSQILYCKWLSPGGKLLAQAENFNIQIKIDPNNIEHVNAFLVDHVDIRNSDGETINTERMPFDHPDEPKAIKRRQLQFNLKTAMLFMVVASSAFAWLGIHLREGWREQEALARLEEFGVKADFRNGRVISLDFSEATDKLSDDDLRHLATFRRLNTLDLAQKPIGDAVLEHIEGLSSLKSLRLDGTKVTDAGLARIEGLTGLRYLHLNNIAITDEGLAHLAPLTKLEWLGLSGTKITDAGLAHLEGLTRMEHLRLGKTQVSDAGMKHLEPLKNLKWLDLNRTQVSDAGLVHLEELIDLQDLVYYHSNITLEGTQRLKKKQPNLTVY